MSRLIGSYLNVWLRSQLQYTVVFSYITVTSVQDVRKANCRTLHIWSIHGNGSRNGICSHVIHVSAESTNFCASLVLKSGLKLG